MRITSKIWTGNDIMLILPIWSSTGHIITCLELKIQHTGPSHQQWFHPPLSSTYPQESLDWKEVKPPPMVPGYRLHWLLVLVTKCIQTSPVSLQILMPHPSQSACCSSSRSLGSKNGNTLQCCLKHQLFFFNSPSREVHIDIQRT